LLEKRGRKKGAALISAPKTKRVPVFLLFEFRMMFSLRGQLWGDRIGVVRK